LNIDYSIFQNYNHSILERIHFMKFKLWHSQVILFLLYNRIIDIPNLKKDDNLEICGYPHLEKIVIKDNSLKNMNSLKICNNEELMNIEIGDGDWDDDSSLRNVNTIILESIWVLFIWHLYLPDLHSFETGYQSFFETTSLSLSSIFNMLAIYKDLPKLQSFITGNYSFYQSTSLSLSSNSILHFVNWIFLIYNLLQLDLSHSINQQVFLYQVRIIEYWWFDLPKLQSFNIGENSLYEVQTMIFSSNSILIIMIE